MKSIDDNTDETEPAEQQATTPIEDLPIVFKECIKFSNGIINLELYSSSLRIDYLSSVLVELKKQLSTDKPKQSGGYVG